MDDTLIDTKAVYDIARQETYTYLTQEYPNLSFSYLKFRATCIKYRNMHKKEDAETRARQSLIKAAQELLKTNLSEEHQNNIIDISDKSFKILPPMKEGVAAALKHINQIRKQFSAKTKIIAFTQGEHAWQKEKFAALPVEVRSIFDELIIVKKKDKQTYERFLAQKKTSSKNATMIGDKENADIIPALEAGMNAYHIPAQTPLDFPSIAAQIQLNKKSSYKKFKRLKDCIPNIKQQMLNRTKRHAKTRIHKP